jgi:RNA polymerase sigma-70 factor, ECF subfamily
MDDITFYLINYRKTKDKIWFEKIYYLFMPKIYNYFYYKTKDKQISEDLSGEVFLKIFNNLETKNLNGQSIKFWIYKIAKNQLIDYIRKTKKDSENILLVDWQDDIEDNSLIEKEFFLKYSVLIKKELGFENQELIEAISRLTQLQKNIIELIFIMDFDYKTIASILGKKQSSIRGILFRAISTLRNELKNE